MFKKMKFIKKLKLKIWFPIGKHRSPTSRWKSYFSKLGLFKKRLTLTSILETRFPVGNRVSKKIGNWRKPIFAGLIFILIIFGVYFLFFHSSEALAEWWNTNWHYRKAITITNSSSAQTDFQVLVTANTSDTTKFQADCDDLRFTSVNGQALDYWIESGCSTATTKVWVKIASIPANISTIYMYYGNSNASSYQSGDNTFIFFDDFDDNSLDTTKWTKDEATTGSITEENNELRIQEYENNYSHIQKSISGYSNFVVEAKLRRVINPGASWAPGIYVWWNDDSGGNNIAWKNRAHMAGIGEVEVITNGTSASTLLTGSVDTNYRWYRIKISSSNFYFDYSTDGISWSTEHTSTRVANFSAAPALIAFGKGAHKSEYTNDEFNNGYSTAGSIGDVRIDNVFVRKYIATEPTATLQSEEKSPGPVAYWSFDEGYGTATSDRTTNNNDGTISGATWQTEDMCISGKCLYFDGSDDYVNCGNGTSLNITEAITVEAWVKGNGFDGTDELFSKINGWGQDFYVSNGILSWQIRLDDNSILTVTGFTISPGAWYHLAYTFVPGDKAYLYVNGKVKGSTVIPSGRTIKSATSNFYIGTWDASPTYSFKGFIDEVKIYPYARTPAQIKADYLAKGGASSKGTAVSLGGRSSQGDYLSDGLVGYWKMNEASGTSVADASGNTNIGTATDADPLDATCLDGDTPPPSAAGKYANARDFDGCDDYVEIGNPANLNLVNRNPFTFEAWVKPDDLSETQNYIVARCGYHTGLMTYAPDGFAFAMWNTDAGYFNAGKANIATAGKWYHLVGVFDGSNVLLYVNGVEEDRKGFTGTPRALYRDWSIGAVHYPDSPPSANRVFNGKIDEVRIYNRALSSREVRQLYEYAPGPVGHWKMDESSWSGVSGEVKDSSGSGNNGTRAGNATTYSPGKYGKAGTFDGSGDYVGVLDSGISDLNDFTVEAWVYLDSSVSDGYPGIISTRTGDESDYVYGVAFQFYNSGGYYLDVEGAAIGGGHFTKVAANSIGSGMSYNKWHHVAMTFDRDGGVGGVIQYVDGIQTTTGTAVDNPTHIDDITIGQRYTSGGMNTNTEFDGLIDDVRIYNYARTQKQILEDMNAGRPAQKSPVAYYKFDQGYGTSAKDNSIYGNDGTITGATWTNAGKFGKALSFNGTSDYVDAGSKDSIDNLPSNDFTVTAWIYPEEDRNGEMRILDKRGTAAVGWFIEFSGYSTKSRRLVGVVDLATTNATTESTDNILTLNEWQNVAMSYNATEKTITIYRNGLNVSDTTTTGVGAVTDDSAALLYFASHENVGVNDRLFNGLLDEVKIYNYALTQDEIKAEYNQGKVNVMGALGGSSGGLASTAGTAEYCVPGDTTSCNPPIAEWNFEENTGISAFDTSGNGNTGTITGANWKPGKIGSALDFDGTGDYVSAGTVSLSNQAFSVMAWVKTSSTSKTIVGTITGGTNNGFALMTGYSQATPFFWVKDGVATQNVYADTAVTDNQWHYVVGVRDGSNSYIYVDGRLAGSIAGSLVTLPASDPVVIGRMRADQHEMLGLIDQVRIYNYARTPAQIAWDYNKGKPIAHWRFDEGEGTTLYDDSDNNNDGTLSLGSLGQTSAGSIKIDANTAWYNGRVGKQNYSLNFDGSDDYVSVADTDNLSFNGEISITCWFKVGTPTGTWMRMISHDSPGAPRYLLNLTSDNYLHYYLEDGTNVRWGNIEIDTDDGNWHFAVLTFKSGSQKLYLDIVNTATSSGILNNFNASGLYIGAYNYGNPTAFFNGQIDDVRIYNYVLTEDQIKTVYNFGSARLGTGE